MKKDRRDLLRLFRDTGVLLDGHFLLTSGRHSSQFLQCSQVLQHPRYAEELARLLADHFHDRPVNAVIGPAMGGVILAYETARQLGVRALFAEKDGDGLVLRRGFHLSPSDEVLVVEDAVTTGGSVGRTMRLVRDCGARVAGVGILVDRSGGTADFGVPSHSLLELDVESYAPAECPLCFRGIPLVSPKDA